VVSQRRFMFFCAKMLDRVVPRYISPAAGAKGDDDV
jgi:hypothetical protein